MANSRISIFSWLPLGFFSASLVKYLYLLYGAINCRYSGGELYYMQQYLSYWSVVLAATIILAFFIRQSKLKWISVIVGCITLFIVVFFSSRFQALHSEDRWSLVSPAHEQ